MDTTNFDRDQKRDNLGHNDDRNQRADRDRGQSGQHQDTDNHKSDSSFSNQDWQSRWTDIRSDYRKRYPSLTEEDVEYGDGDFDNMTDRIAKRTNRNFQNVQDEIRNWNPEERNSGDKSFNDGDPHVDNSY